MIPSIIKGSVHSDERGDLSYNNCFDLSFVKRIYFIENRNSSIVRAWQGHRIEQRWFSAVAGGFNVLLIKIDDWDAPSKYLNKMEFILNAEALDVLHVPKGYVSSIQAIQKDSKLLVMADYAIGEIKDEYKYPQSYFEIK